MATESPPPRRPSAIEIVRAMQERNAPHRAAVMRRVARMRRYAAALRAGRP